ncbi:replication protein RepA [Halomonas sp. AOP1-B1-8]|uniref:replication protein RepA n=1 Tax=Halomonas sp. AOP1-B1-8 TaxID=3457726 RepID=UPI003FDA9235
MDSHEDEQAPGVRIPRRVDHLTSAYLAMECEDAKSAGTLGYMARSVVQATLPHTDPKTSYFERTNGIVTLSVLGRPQVGLPYGSMPRILLAWICTEAVRTKEPVLFLGRSQNEFLSKLQLPTTGQYIKAIKNQAHRLFSSVITVSAENDSQIALENILIAKKAAIFWSPKHPDQPSLWESQLTLTQDFFEEVTSAPVPIDMRAYQALRKSPLALDIYAWLTYRMFLLHSSGRQKVVIPWGALMLQMGSSYANHQVGDEKKRKQAIANFRVQFLKKLRDVLGLYPEARNAINEVDNGLMVRRAPLHIKPSQSKI